MGKGVAFINRNCVGDTISGIHDDASGTTGSIEGEHSLDGDVHCRCVKSFKHDLGHALAVRLRVQWSLCEEDRVLFWCNTELIVEGMVPNLFHIVPIGDNAVFNGVLQCQDTTLAL